MKKNLLFISCLLIFITAANAQSWVVQHSNFPTDFTGIIDMSLVDENVVWALGADGAGTGTNSIDFTRTIDGGNVWAAGTVGTDTNYRFSNISAVSADTAFVCMFRNRPTRGGGAILRTDDGGNSWVRKDTN